MQLDPAMRQKIQDAIEGWAEDMKFGRATKMDAAGVAQGIRMLKRDRDREQCHPDRVVPSAN